MKHNDDHHIEITAKVQLCHLCVGENTPLSSLTSGCLNRKKIMPGNWKSNQPENLTNHMWLGRSKVSEESLLKPVSYPTIIPNCFSILIFIPTGMWESYSLAVKDGPFHSSQGSCQRATTSHDAQSNWLSGVPHQLITLQHKPYT